MPPPAGCLLAFSVAESRRTQTPTYLTANHYTNTVFACLLSQIIVATRTYAISRKESWVKWTLTALFCKFLSSSSVGFSDSILSIDSQVASMVPEFMGNVYKRRRKSPNHFSKIKSVN